jgi:wyosine [tRNA(Phe)-imidazoG37] synthetase (radical SAM superfamily)
MFQNGKEPDVITFAGNGEPTMHPNFAEIIDNTIRLRNLYCPETKITVLSNATQIDKPDVFEALLKIDNNVQKLDSAFLETIKLINNPSKSYDLIKTADNLKNFAGKVIIQTLFVKGSLNGIQVDNSTNVEVLAWLDLIKQISPSRVMIYPIDRSTPVETLEKISIERMNEIALLVKKTGIEVQAIN